MPQQYQYQKIGQKPRQRYRPAPSIFAGMGGMGKLEHGGFLWKPKGDHATILIPQVHTGHIKEVTIVDRDGNVVGRPRLRQQSRGGIYEDGGQTIWDTDTAPGSYPEGSRVKVVQDDNKEFHFDATGNLRSDNGKPGSAEGGGSAVDVSGAPLPPGTQGGGTAGVAALPYYLGSQYPTFQPVDFPSIEAAPYKPTDPQAFAEKFGDFQRVQIGKNFDQSKGMALDTLANELQGLQAFAPAAAALSREQISADNQFNQAQRTSQVDSALPFARQDLERQRQRSQAYVEGRLPQEQLDRALETTMRSRAADRAGFSGIGARSQQAQKLSDLMSAEERLQISQYGEGLQNQNLSAQASLFLAPTEYSQAGSKVPIVPEVGAGRLTTSYLGAVNEATLVSPGQALSSTIQQEQFVTGLEDQTRRFNATGQFDASRYNSSNIFAAELGKFNYDVSYLNALQGAAQQNTTMAAAVEWQLLQNQGFIQGQGQGQDQQTTQDTTTAMGGLPQAIQSIRDILGLGNEQPNNQQPNTQPQTTTSPGTNTNQTGAPPSDSGGVGQTQVPDTNPMNGDLPVGIEKSAPQLTTVSGEPAGAVSPDGGSPGAMKFMPGTVPQGYTSVAPNGDGTVSAVPTSNYSAELDRVARSNGGSPGSITVQNAALADRSVANATGLSYVPIPGFERISTTYQGQPVHTLPRIANSGDYGTGRENMLNVARAIAGYGVSDTDVYNHIGELSQLVSDPAFLSELDNVATENGAGAIGQTLADRVLGSKPDLTKNEGQQFAFAANRIGELWQDLSPRQKSMALTSLAANSIKLKTGKDYSQHVVPGTKDSPLGPLRVGEAVQLTSQGYNGVALARNWNQLSAIAKINNLGNSRSTALMSQQTGLLGYGPQGASVPLKLGELKSFGAEPAPEFGVGAAVFRSGQIPKSYARVSTTPDGEIIAMPKNLLHTNSLGGKQPQPLAYEKTKRIAAGQHPAQKLWGDAPSEHIRGSAGGSAIVSGLGIMSKANPKMAGAIIAHSLYRNTLG